MMHIGEKKLPWFSVLVLQTGGYKIHTQQTQINLFFLEKVENVKLNKSFSKSMFFFDPFIHEKIQAKEVVRLDAFCRCDSSELDKCSIPKKKQMDS